MRINAFQAYPLTADVWDYVETGSGSVLQKQYSYRETVDIAFSNDPQTPRVNVLSETPLQKDWLILNIRDRNGNDFMPGAQYRVTVTEAIINALGYQEGYRVRVAMAVQPVFEE